MSDQPKRLRGIFNETRSFVAWFPGERVGGACPTRSRLEHHALALFEFDPAFLAVRRNDLTLREQLGLKLQIDEANYIVPTQFGRYTPDFRVTLHDRTIFASVGTLAAKTQPPEPSRLRAVRERMAADGYELLMLTEREIRGTKRARNLLRLVGPLARPAPQPDIAQELSLRLTEGTSIADAVTALIALHRDRYEWDIANAAWSLVARAAHEGRLDFDLDQRDLDLHAFVRVVKQEEAMSA